MISFTVVNKNNDENYLFSMKSCGISFDERERHLGNTDSVRLSQRNNRSGPLKSVSAVKFVSQLILNVFTH